MATEILRTEIYENVNGVTTLKNVYETEVNVPTTEELIAEKEAQLLAMYNEIQALKQK